MKNGSDFNYKKGEVVDVEQEFGVEKISSTKYVGKKPLTLPAPESRGVFGGNLCGQALLVAMKSAGPDFQPHSLHSYFVRAGSSKVPVTWEVEEISTGKTFCNRNLKAIQDGRIVFIASISLTKRNSYRKAMNVYNEYYSKIQQNAKDNDEDEDEGDSDVPPPVKPFIFQTPQHEWLNRSDLDKLPVSDIESSMLIYLKFFPEFLKLDASKNEDKLSVTDRKLSFLLKWGIENEQGFNQPLKNVDSSFQFVGLANLSDALYLNAITRILRIEDFPIQDHAKSYFSVSLDHIIYFHDDDFDVTKWMGLSFKAIRFAHNRVIIEGEIFNDRGVHVATIIQEGLVLLEGKEKGAKL